MSKLLLVASARLFFMVAFWSVFITALDGRPRIVSGLWLVAAALMFWPAYRWRAR